MCSPMIGLASSYLLCNFLWWILGQPMAYELCIVILKMYISCWKVTGNDRSEISVQNLNAFLSTFDKVTTSLKKTRHPHTIILYLHLFCFGTKSGHILCLLFSRYNHIYFPPTYIWQSSFKITLLHWKITAGSSPTFLPTPQ